ncbi:leucine-rich repeat domain-containing protein [Brachyspira pilosicoli]|uniref:leucine-rich repeat domain-containing protein n=1 Tax=Brachyspira pilosicoli TaxID=52584 RepID=UPI0024304AAE|nr:leucine-rich repeat domain-containing protein [Brachyspira pilosicoli]
MFKKAIYLLIIFILVISCRRAVTRPTLDSLGSTPPEEPDSPIIDEKPEQPDPIPEPKPESEFIIVATDTEDIIQSKIQKYYEKNQKYLAFVEGTEADIKQNNTISKINSVINKNAYTEGISLDLSYTTMTEIADNSFYGNKYLYSVKLPDTLTSIGNNAFADAKKLISINFPASLSKIGEGAFLSCTSLENVDLKDTKITVLNKQVFSDCSSLTKIVFPDSLLIMENSVFSYCISLEEITLPDKFQAIGTFVFAGCSKLKKVNFNNQIQSIYHYAFYKCTSLSSISLPSSLKALGEEGKIEIFPDCTSLSDVEYLGTNPDSVTWFGNIFDNSMPNNLYLPYVEEPTDPTIKDKWNKFLGYSWSGKIRYKTPMPVN